MKIALLGFGTVGRGAYETLEGFPEIEVKRVLVRRARVCGACDVTAEFGEILDDPEIALVAEAMGGVEPARTYVLAAMEKGKHVVSANKELLSRCFSELYAAAAKNGVCLMYTACVGGGVPWLCNLERAMRCDEITEIGGIVNGTTNFILHAMQANALSFDAALKTAQALGYAEAEPGADIDGFDAARKCAVSASLAFGTVLDEERLHVEGIRRVNESDIAFAKARGKVLKLMAVSVRRENAVSAYVEPCFVEAGSQEAAVPGNNNLISLTGKRLKKQSFFGQGAGMYPTGIAVAQDILDVARGLVCPPSGKMRPLPVDNAACVHPYYIRCGANCDSEALNALAEEYAYAGESRAFLLKPMPVPAMHALVQRLRVNDPQLFFAGMGEGV